MTREELMRSKSYHLTRIQNELFRQVNEYIVGKGINRSKFASELGVTKGYVTQVLNGDFDFKLSKFIELTIAIGKIPEISYMPINEFLESQSKSQSEFSYIIDTETKDESKHKTGKIIPFHQNQEPRVFSSICK